MVVQLALKMILPNNKHTSYLENAINNSLLLYREDIIALFKKSWKEEDLNEVSDSQFHAGQLNLAIQLVTLVYLDVIRGVNTDWDYYVSKYNLETYKKCLSCDKINLDKILEKFGLPNVGEKGINFQQIETTFIIEFQNSINTLSSVNVIDILNASESCKIFLDNETCLYQKCEL